ncbi:hypothetical protein P152DRAFT_449551 [Eremomyces bilateralis CBS 781.70]|uniref:Uncharacterized protein n=1 Tax=Eremomyces bilateralis CBS 781.70 TaxID=1392243 RepID=A0A6G1G2Y1_9PEZI|nr:uncharacterized protein P152DRAFT_449551 [Eremomyces bilateralis CBS 781.70]KAF1812280.1 hypothetical protein P152DRAFT_449551 [Eremomyces bilateralis CBS 781.70]
MKSLILFSLPLLASAVPTSNPQSKRGLMDLFLDTLPVVNTTEKTPAIRPDAKRTVVTWGPIEMVPGNADKPFGSFSMDPRGETFMSILKEGFPKDASVLAGQFEVKLADGEPAGVEAGLYTHHMLTFVNKKSNSWIAECDKSTIDPSGEPASGLAGLFSGAGGSSGSSGLSSLFGGSSGSGGSSGLSGLLGGASSAGGASGSGKGIPSIRVSASSSGGISYMDATNDTSGSATTPASSSAGAASGGHSHSHRRRQIGGLGISAFLMVGEDNGNAPVYYTDPDGKLESGYYLPADAEITVQSDLVNYKDEPLEVYLSMDLEYMPGKFGPDTKTKLMNIQGCTGREIKLDTAGESRTTSDKFAILEDGYIINGKGHLHDGGVSMILLVNDKEVCTSKATYGGAGGTMELDGEKWETISNMNRCPEPIPIKKGDYITMTAVYDLKLHPLRTQGATSGGMEGMEMGGHSHRSRDEGAGHGDGHGAEVMGMWDLTFAPMAVTDSPILGNGTSSGNSTTPGSGTSSGNGTTSRR